MELIESKAFITKGGAHTQLANHYWECMLQKNFIDNMFPPTNTGDSAKIQTMLGLMWAKYPIQIGFTSLYYQYNHLTQKPYDVNPEGISNRTLFGGDLVEMKIIFAIRAEAFLQTWLQLHTITPKMERIFKTYKVPIPSPIISPAYDTSFSQTNTFTEVQAWTHQFWTRVSTTTVTWLFLRQVIAYACHQEPKEFPHPTFLEPSYNVVYKDSIPICIKVTNGTPEYNWYNNQESYLSIRQVLAHMIPGTPSSMQTKYLISCSAKEFDNWTSKRSQEGITEARKILAEVHLAQLNEALTSKLIDSQMASSLAKSTQEAMEKEGSDMEISPNSSKSSIQLDSASQDAVNGSVDMNHKSPTQRALDGDETDEEIEDNFDQVMADYSALKEGTAEEDLWESFQIVPHPKEVRRSGRKRRPFKKF